MRLALDGRYMYQLPWYVFVGAPGSGKDHRAAQRRLRFPLAEQMGEHAVRGVGGTRLRLVVHRPGGADRHRPLHHAGQRRRQRQATWTGFLGLLKRARPRQAF